MSRHQQDRLFPLVESFFCEHLRRTPNASRHTVLAYGDALRLFFSFVADARGVNAADLRLDNLTVEHVLGFLEHIESNRHNTTATRNLRLTAIRSFFRHLVRYDPPHAAQYQRVLSLPFRKASSSVATYLEPEEVTLLLSSRGVRPLAAAICS
jgi:integrase/recombinase XerD